MKTLILNTLFVILWTIIGYFYPTITLFTSYIVFPIVFILIAFCCKTKISRFIIILFSFALILIHDYLFRIFGGGTHDDAGRAWCELMFYSTWKYSSIALILNMLKFNYKISKQSFKKKLRYLILTRDVIYVLVLSAITYYFFKNVNIYI